MIKHFILEIYVTKMSAFMLLLCHPEHIFKNSVILHQNLLCLQTLNHLSSSLLLNSLLLFSISISLYSSFSLFLFSLFFLHYLCVCVTLTISHCRSLCQPQKLLCWYFLSLYLSLAIYLSIFTLFSLSLSVYSKFIYIFFCLLM